ncbi:MAG: T9SS type A sorting domain-containing protein, partial [Flavobacteriales bacterium]
VYNNTAGNPNNPNVPPENVSAGLNTSDEMCLVFMHYMAYQAGDENYNMDSLMNLSTASIIENEENYFSVYPNPFIDELNLFSKKLESEDQLRISIYNGQGSLIKSLLNSSINNGSEFHIKWDGKDSEGKTTSPGLYFVSINLNGEFYSKRVIKQR